MCRSRADSLRLVPLGLLTWRKKRILGREDLPVVSPPLCNVLQVRVDVPLGVGGASRRRSGKPDTTTVMSITISVGERKSLI